MTVEEITCWGVLIFRTVVADEHSRGPVIRGSAIGKMGVVARGRVEWSVESGGWRGGDDDDSDEEEEALGRSALPMWRERAGAKID